MLEKERVFGESVVGDMGDPLESPLFGLYYLRRDVDDLRDISHRGGNTLEVEVSADRCGKGGVRYKIGEFNIFVERFFS